MSKLRRCACCKQIIPPAAGPFETMPVKNRIYTFIARHPEGVTCREIMDHVYQLDPNGGPDSDNVIRVHLTKMRPWLTKLGMTIVASNRGRGGGGVYKLVPIANVNTPKPRLSITKRGQVKSFFKSAA